MSEEHIREIEEPGKTAPVKETEKPEEKETWGSFAWFLLKLVIVVLIFRTFAFTSFNIPSESMMPRLLVGDYLFAQKWSYGYSTNSLPFGIDAGDWRIFPSEPEYGDVVIFKHPIDRTDYIKRVVALPGDRVQMIDGALHLNGKAVGLERIEDFVVERTPDNPCHGDPALSPGVTSSRSDGTRICRFPQFRETLPNGVSYNIIDTGASWADNTSPVVVPEGQMFLMGDHRDNSQDSRFPQEAGKGVGLVPQENLVAEASFMYWSWDGGPRFGRIGRGI